MSNYKILVIGVTGMLGHTLFTSLSEEGRLDVSGTARSISGLEKWFEPRLLLNIKGGVDAASFESVLCVLDEIRPEVVINCIGIIKQLPEAKDPLISISINSLFPHKLAGACREIGARLIHMSTDCVFSGTKGMYTEDDKPDADDLYGRTKLLGEVDYPHCVTLRTSIIGHELMGNHGLIAWFLGQEGKVLGFTNAVFSGFPTIEMARIISNYVVPDSGLSGLYHVSSAPISKYDLLLEVAGRYGKQIEIEGYDGLRCDRSLNSGRFKKTTGYSPPAWHELIETMYTHFMSTPYYQKQ